MKNLEAFYFLLSVGKRKTGADYLINNGAEACDVAIRCYLLGEYIVGALEEIEDDSYAAKEEKR